MYRKILVPMDGSKTAEDVAGWAAKLAQGIGAEMVLLAVVDPAAVRRPDRESLLDRSEESRSHTLAAAVPGAQTGIVTARPLHEGGKPVLAPAAGMQIVDNAAATADSYLVGQKHRLAEHGANVAAKVVIGEPAERIVAAAEELGADLIAMATHRESPIARGVLGSVTDRVLHTSKVPVLAVHPKGRVQLGTTASAPKVIFVPLDGSARSATAVPVATDLARRLSARLEFLRVAWRYAGPAWPDEDWTPPEEESEDQKRQMFEYLGTFVDEAKANGVDAEARALFGSAASRIIEETGTVEDAMIVMTTRGASGFARWAVGSVADKVLRSSGIPVLVLPPKAP